MNPTFAAVRQQLELAKREAACFEQAEAALTRLLTPVDRTWTLRAVRVFAVEGTYSGIERMLRLIADGIDGRVPSGRDWHAVLLKAMAARGPSGRPAVIRPETYELLDDLRRFRHVARHHYGLGLDEAGVEENVAVMRRV